MSDSLAALTAAGENALGSVSFALLLFPLLDLWRRHVLTTLPRPNHPKWIYPFVVVGYLSILTSIILSIAVAAKINPLSYKDDMLRALWRAMYVTALGTVSINIIALVITHFAFRLGRRGTIYLFAAMMLSLLVCVYRVVQIFTDSPTAPIRSRAAYYTLEGVADFLVLVMLISVNLREWFPGERIRTPRTKPGTIAQAAMLAETGKNKLHKTKLHEADKYV